MSTPQDGDSAISDAALLPSDGDTASPARRSRRPWLLVGIVLAVVALAGLATAVLLFLTPTASAQPSATVRDFDRAYAEVDCELFVAVTTVAYREGVAPTCADFEDEAQSFVDNFSDYEVVIDSTAIDGATATVVTTETWVLDGQESSEEYTYTLVGEGGTWRIDALE